ncbi:MAG: hypothetical protein EOL91_07560 [Actinobacteria bacterium]|nr:hypothetical protein [Actinomycetota bacterium]
MTHLTVAGHTVEDPVSVFERYAKQYGRTLAEYDFAPQPDPDEIARQDAITTRIIASRISNAQAQQIVERARANRELLQAIPVEARLHDADPAETDGLYDAMSALHAALQGPGVRDSKVSKLLHLKRPSLYPILDSALARFYRQAARDAAARYPERGFRRMAWAAIRDDVITNQEQLDALRPALAANPVLKARRVHELGDLRLLDILAWNTQHG